MEKKGERRQTRQRNRNNKETQPAVVDEWSKALSQIQVERMP